MALAVLTLLRPGQWLKNGFVVVPLFFTPAAITAATVAAVAGGAVCFCLLASAVYILNDYADRTADRLHPTKCRRPLAAGTVPVPLAFGVLGLLAATGLALAGGLSGPFLLVALAYLASNLLYSFRLKHVAIVDVMIVAFGFVLRVEGGALLAGVKASSWLVIMTGLLTLFIALAKRRDDLIQDLGGRHRGSLDGYTKPFVDAAVSVTLGALMVSYLIYTTDETVMRRLHSEHLYYTAPFVVAGILRYLQVTLVDERSGSPVRLLVTDRFLLIAVLGWIASFGFLIYG